ncbi:MAG: hypothetical protein AAF322_10155 [Pseudomonadota bacterium]
MTGGAARKDYLLVEVASLRAEILGHQAARYGVDQFGLTAVALIYAWIVATGGSAAALWLPPLVCFVAALRQRTIFFSIRKISNYLTLIEDELAVWGWESYLRGVKSPKRISALSHYVWATMTLVTSVVAMAEAFGFRVLARLAPPKLAF